MQEWFQKDKLSLNSNLPNLPYIIDDGFTLTESSAILRYIIEKSKNYQLLGGDSLQQKAIVQQLIGATDTILNKIVQYAYHQDYENVKNTYYAENLQEKVENMSKQLGNKKYLTGDEICLADITFYDAVIKLMLMFPQDMQKIENLKTFKTNFEQIPQIQKYRNSDKYIKAPFFASFASWNLKPEDYNI